MIKNYCDSPICLYTYPPTYYHYLSSRRLWRLPHSINHSLKHYLPDFLHSTISDCRPEYLCPTVGPIRPRDEDEE